jgi:hypothetical protein
MLIKLTEGNKVPDRVQLMRVGNFLYEGDDLQITPNLLLSFKNNFNEKVRGYDDGKLPIDYFHENERIAAGWIANLDLENNDTELWADVQWTPKASQMICDGELRYLSAEFHFDYQHNEGGKKFGPTLLGAGLTNRPFIKGMKPVKTLSEGAGEMNLEQAMAKIAELEKQIAELQKAAQEDQAADDAGTEMGELKKKLAAMEADAEKNKEEKKKLEEEKKCAEQKAKFDKMLSEGKSIEAQREAFMSGDMIKFADLAKPVNMSAQGSATAGSKAPVQGDAQDQVLALAEAYAKEKKVSLSEGIREILSSNKALREQYEKEVTV